jgi:hypothetical protein
MIRFLLVSATGWTAVLLAGVEIALPYMLRNSVRAQSVRARMWPHYWLGYVLVALILTHSSFVMGPAMGRSDAFGIWAATLALCVIFLQVGLGLILKSGTGLQSQVRRWHFWSMVAFTALLLTHLWRNA